MHFKVQSSTNSVIFICCDLRLKLIDLKLFSLSMKLFTICCIIKTQDKVSCSGAGPINFRSSVHCIRLLNFITGQHKINKIMKSRHEGRPRVSSARLNK